MSHFQSFAGACIRLLMNEPDVVMVNPRGVTGFVVPLAFPSHFI